MLRGGLFRIRFLGVGGGKSGVGAEGIDEIGDKILFSGAGFDDFFFVFHDDFVVGDFNDFTAMND